MHDVIIIGAGVAGSFLAKKLEGLDVLLLEKDKRIFVKDSGIVSQRFKNFFDKKFVKKIIKEKISRMVLVSPSGDKISLRVSAFLLNRKMFSRKLRMMNNNVIAYEKAEKIRYGRNIVVTTDRNEYKCKLLVGADGALSITRKALGIKIPFLYHGVIARTKNKINMKDIHVYFNKNYSSDFFSWVIPQNNEYGLIAKKNPKDRFRYFKDALDLPNSRLHMAPIPIGITKSYGQRTLLVGDAAGMIKPLTGGGIVFSLTAASHAASLINNVFEKHNFGAVPEYEKAWKNDFGNEIKKQLMLRMIYRRLNNRMINRLFVSIKPMIKKMGKFDYDFLSDIPRRLICSKFKTRFMFI